MYAYITGITEEDVQRERDEILAAREEDIRDCAEMVEAILSEDRICVLGNEEKVKENQELFEVTVTM